MHALFSFILVAQIQTVNETVKMAAKDDGRGGHISNLPKIMGGGGACLSRDSCLGFYSSTIIWNENCMPKISERVGMSSCYFAKECLTCQNFCSERFRRRHLVQNAVLTPN